MKKISFLFTAFFVTLSACSPVAAPQPQATNPVPFSETDLQATVAVQVERTLQSLPTLTLAPSNTPVVITATNAPTQTQALPTPSTTETQSSAQTATPGTVPVMTETAINLTLTAMPTLASNATPTGTAHFQYAGTMPPNLPHGHISIINMSKVDASIALRCVTRDGYVTYLDYPLGGSTVNDNIPAGSYTYVAWVGGKKSEGRFKLGVLQDLRFLIYKNRIEIKQH
jgi:hypothetical protein